MNPSCTNKSLPRYILAVFASVLSLSVFTPPAHSESIGLSWAPNSESDLAGYKLYRGSSTGQYNWVKDAGLSTIIQVDSLTPNQTYYFTVTAYNTQNLESEPSNVVQVTPTPDSTPPVAQPQSLVTAEDISLTIALKASDIDADPLTYLVSRAPTQGTLTGTPPNLVYSPKLNFNGTDSFEFTALDGKTSSVPAKVSITVTAVNDPPTAVGLAIATVAGNPVEFALDYSDVDSSSLSHTITRRPLKGTLTASGTQLVYTANSDFSGSDSLEYTVSDGSLTSSPATVLFTVNPRPNTPPVAQPQSLVTAEDITLTIALKASDIDVNPLTYLVSRAPTQGTLTGTPPNLVYSPKSNFNGTDSFEFTALDGKASSVPAKVSITVTAVNDPPIAVGLAITTVAGNTVEFALDYSDVDNSSLSHTITRRPLKGTLTASGTQLVYTANSDYSGSDSLEYTVSDGSLTSSPATVLFTVNPRPNTPPVAQTQSLVTAEDTGLTIALKASDIDANSLTYLVSRGPTQGTLTGTPPSVTYSPKLNFNGTDSFEFTALDGKTSSVPAKVSITVTAVNDRPVATSFAASATAGIPVELSLRGTDIETTSLTFKVTQIPRGGTLVGLGSLRIYTPNDGFSGTDTIQFTASDESAESLPATITIEVKEAGNTAPKAIAQSQVTYEDSSLAIKLLASDGQNDPLTYSITSQPTRGRLTGTPPQLQYIPNPNTNGVDTFRFSASDGKLNSAEASVTIEIIPVNDAPTTVSQSLSMFEDGPLNVTLKGQDADNDTLRFSIKQAPTYGKLTGTAPSYTYTPNTNYFGLDSFVYEVSDGIAPAATGKVSFTIREVNDPPVSTPLNVTLKEDAQASFRLVGSDIENSPLKFIIDKQPLKGKATGIAPNLYYTPSANFSGTDSMTYYVSDGLANSATNVVTFNVTEVNDKPKALSLRFTTPYNTPVSVLLKGTDTENSPLTFKISKSPSRGSLSGTSPNLTYKPNSGFFGIDSFEFTVSDGQLTSVAGLVSVSVVKPVQLSSPQADATLVSVSGSTSRLIDGATSVTANDGTPTSTPVAIQDAPRHGTVQLAADGTFTYRHAGGSDTEDSFSYTTLTDGIVSAPTVVRVHVFQLSGLSREIDQVVLSFPTVAGVVYRVEGNVFSAGSLATWQLLGELTSPVQSAAEVPTAALADGTSRFFRVTATDANGTLVTEPFGFQRFTLGAGVRTYTSPFQGAKALGTSVASASGDTVELGDTGSLMEGQFKSSNSTASHAIMVPGTAHWWPILGNGVDRLIVDPRGSDLASVLQAGTQVEIIEMPTATQIFGPAGIPDSALQPGDYADFVNGNGVVSTIVCRSLTDGSSAYCLSNPDQLESSIDASAMSFLPGQPIQLQKAGAAGTLWFLGRVQSNPLTPYRVGNTETNGSDSQ